MALRTLKIYNPPRLNKKKDIYEVLDEEIKIYNPPRLNKKTDIF